MGRPFIMKPDGTLVLDPINHYVPKIQERVKAISKLNDELGYVTQIGWCEKGYIFGQLHKTSHVDGVEVCITIDLVRKGYELDHWVNYEVDYDECAKIPSPEELMSALPKMVLSTEFAQLIINWLKEQQYLIDFVERTYEQVLNEHL